MRYLKTITLKDGRICTLRNGEESDGQAVLANFILTHEQTDYLLSYPDESTMTAEQEGRFLQEKTDSDNGIEILAEVDGVVAGLAGFDAVGGREKIRHRADFGISVDRQYWNLGIGTALMNACIECARAAGYEQIELSVVAENEPAIAMYRKHRCPQTTPEVEVVPCRGAAMAARRSIGCSTTSGRSRSALPTELR